MRWRQCGFTLVELLVVILIIATFVTVVYPKFSDGLLEPQRLRSSVSKIASVAEYAHERAISTHLTHQLNINIEHGTYEVSAHKADGQIVMESGDINLEGRLPEGVYFIGVEYEDKKLYSGEPVSVEFNPQGWIEPVTIYVASSEGRKMGIVIREMLSSVKTFKVIE